MLESDNCRSSMTNRRSTRLESRGTSVARILDAAETLCAIYGSAKTNVCDIARYLKMSPANVYRFFPSKLALYDALVARVLEGNFPVMQSSSDGSTTAESLLEFMLGLHRRLFTLMLDGEKLFELLTVADDQCWPAFGAYAQGVRGIVAEFVEKGVRAQEFRQQDSLRAAECLCASTVALWEPKAIKKFYFRRSLITPEGLIFFSVQALRSGPINAGGDRLSRSLCGVSGAAGR